ncbi:MAG: winged helix-turn-helix transcriptional regulator [Candidatus Nanopelagicales bacterium]|mgnify:CR=1 FL=1|nr:winged helix-turn-helix transcriptional regulator [Candidatus Nanopelagicales bacterium]MDP4716065.1 winged helix-turn-helix transcriptional regulator [Candidatus Nanopelagicales bacterium]MDP4906482.1 winged helix-turn-helix transcriptional regulator [Candidatus Nanopelagicales bacterium]MDP4975848.1 winged helix-turn-helix transcriptional regulator [Candidatus Nanopelagicales bacterium]MDP5095714.1 winged helix-turn-helix transcriptional regulator [Candidatus Nanopelagicales bacterium]
MKLPSPGAERVARSLLDGGPATAAELAVVLGLSPTVVRRHLESLVADGYARAGDHRPYGPTPVRGRGRPARVFTLTDEGSHVFNVAYDDLALSALDYLNAHFGADSVRNFARLRAESLVQRHIASVASSEDPRVRLTLLAEGLTVEGYAATTAETEAGPQLCQHHCPVRHVADRYPQLCEAETEAFGQLLGTHVLRLATIGRGDGVCTTLVPALMNRRTSA